MKRIISAVLIVAAVFIFAVHFAVAKELSDNAPVTNTLAKPKTPTVCGDGHCDDQEKGRCERDCQENAENPDANTPLFLPRGKLDELQKQIDEQKSKSSSEETKKEDKKPAGPTVCGDGLCDDREKGRCDRDCAPSEGDAAEPGHRFVNRSEVQKLQKQLEELKSESSSTDSGQTTKPSGPTVCGDGECDEREKGRCDRDCGAN